MDRATWLKRVNAILFFLLLYQGVTGMASELINPDVFEVIHPIGGVLLVVVGLVHLVLNWGWVRTVYLKKK